MGFHNPITTAEDPTARAMANQALTEIIPGTRLAADAIDGKTITGATVQTAASGPRAVFSSLGGSEFLQLFAGHTGESPGGVGQVIWPVTGGYRADVYLTPSAVIPVGGGGGPVLPEIIISRDPSTANQITIDAATGGTVTLKGNVSINGQPWAQPRAQRFPRASFTTHSTDPITSTNGMTPLMSGTWAAAPAGDYHIFGTLVMQGSAAGIGNLELLAGSPTAPASLTDGNPRVDLTTSYLPYSFDEVATWGGGDLNAVLGYQVASAGVTATIQTAGSVLCVEYLGPRT